MKILRFTMALILGIIVLAGCVRQERVSMFEGQTTEAALARLSKKFGASAKALSVDLTALSLTVRVQDPAHPSHIDEYRLEHFYALGDRFHQVNVFGPTPVQLTLINEKLEENLFALSDLKLGEMAATSKTALDRTALEAGAVANVHIQRHLYLVPVASCGEVEWEIALKSAREYAMAYADARGRITRLNLDGTNRAKSLNLFADGKELLGVVEALRQTFGSNRAVLTLHLNRKFLGFDARDPNKPKRLMNFTANLNGVLMRLEAFNGGPGAEPLPDERFFAVDDVDWSCVPELLKQADEKLAIPNGKLYDVTLSKPTHEGIAQALRWTVQIRDGEGENGEVTFDSHGLLTHLQLPKSRRLPLNTFDGEGARQAMAGIHQSFGAHAKLLELAFSGNRAAIVARDPKQPQTIRDWLYEDDHFLDFKGTNQTPFYRELQEASFFDLDEIANVLPLKLAALEKAALERLKMPAGKIERVTVCRQQKMEPLSAKLTVQIDIKNADEKSGWVRYDLDGNFVEIMTP